MPEDVLFETESRRTRADIASYLRTVADRLDADDEITFSAGSEVVTLEPPNSPTFEVKVERETSAGEDAGELSIEFELEWDERESDNEEGDGSLTIE